MERLHQWLLLTVVCCMVDVSLGYDSEQILRNFTLVTACIVLSDALWWMWCKMIEQ